MISFPQRDLEVFRQRYWPNELYCGKLPTTYAALAADLPLVMDTQKLSPRDVPFVRVHRMLENRYATAVVSKADFDQIEPMTTWSLEQCQEYCSQIKSFISDLGDYLCIGASRVSATIFVSTGIDGLPWHFDPVEVLILPLIGRKTWFLAENRIVRFPFHKFIPAAPSDSDAELALHSNGPLSAPIASDRAWIGEPGRTCFLPRGWWHRTEVSVPSVSLSVALRTPRLMDVFLARLESRLKLSARWRQPVSFTLSESAAVSRTLEKVARSLALSEEP